LQAARPRRRKLATAKAAVFGRTAHFQKSLSHATTPRMPPLRATMTEIRVEAGSSQPQQDRIAPPLHIWLELILRQASRCNRPSSLELHCTLRQAPRLEVHCSPRQSPRLEVHCTLRQAPRWIFVAPAVRPLVGSSLHPSSGPSLEPISAFLARPLVGTHQRIPRQAPRWNRRLPSSSLPSAAAAPTARCAQKRRWRRIWIGAGLGFGARGLAGLCATMSSCGSCCQEQVRGTPA
jgi:hypothetical protein